MCCIRQVVSSATAATHLTLAPTIHTHGAYWWRDMSGVGSHPPSICLSWRHPHIHLCTRLSTCEQYEATGKWMFAYSPYISHTMEAKLSSYIMSSGSSLYTHAHVIHNVMSYWDSSMSFSLMCVDVSVPWQSSTPAATCICASWWYTGVYGWCIINNAVSRMPTLPNLTHTQSLVCIIKCISRPISEQPKIEMGRHFI